MRAFRGIAIACVLGSVVWVGLIGGLVKLVRADGVCPSDLAGWHTPGAHSGLNVHEHGHQPYSWVTGAFTQCRESHQGYKMMCTTIANGIQSCLQSHIVSTTGARSHGDHDVALWVREPSGAISHWGLHGSSNTSVFDFGTPPTLLSYKDMNVIPSIQQSGTAPVAENWLDSQNRLVVDVILNIYDPIQNLSGGSLGGNGTSRSTRWILYGNRLPGLYAQSVSSTLTAMCNPSCLFDTPTIEFQPTGKGAVVIGTPN